MSLGKNSKTILGAAGLLGLSFMSTAQAVPVGITFSDITMEVRTTANTRVGALDTIGTLMARFNSGAHLCTQSLNEFSLVGGPQNCGTGVTNLATLYTVNFSLNGGPALFELGADWGLGGIISNVDGSDIVRTDDIWWGYNWNNGDVLNFSLNGSQSGSFQLLGFERCCSGANSLRVSVDGGQTFSAVKTPEPAPLALLGFGLLGLAAMRRRHN